MNVEAGFRPEARLGSERPIHPNVWGIRMLTSADIPATKPTFFGVPKSWTGWTALGLLLAGVLQSFVRRPLGFRLVFATLIVAGLVGLLAVLWKKERSLLVWIPLVIGTLAALVVCAEILSPH